eukprot:366343-Chlamydomonas_euryale.AAC.6
MARAPLLRLGQLRLRQDETPLRQVQRAITGRAGAALVQQRACIARGFEVRRQGRRDLRSAAASMHENPPSAASSRRPAVFRPTCRLDAAERRRVHSSPPDLEICGSSGETRRNLWARRRQPPTISQPQARPTSASHAAPN